MIPNQTFLRSFYYRTKIKGEVCEISDCNNEAVWINEADHKKKAVYYFCDDHGVISMFYDKSLMYVLVLLCKGCLIGNCERNLHSIES